MMTLVVVIVVASALVAAAVAVSQRLGRAPAGVRVRRRVLPTHPEIVPAAATPPAPPPEEPSASVDEAPITWTTQLNAAPLDEAARLRLIDDLGMLRAAWCVPLLTKAYDEERLPLHRQRALAALAGCEHAETARATFERALASDDEHERAIAQEALARFNDASTV